MTQVSPDSSHAHALNGAQSRSFPVEVPAAADGTTRALRRDATLRTTTPLVAVIIVTWNRWQMADRVLAALARQSFPLESMHVTVIDNASTDGTLERLDEQWGADRIIDNATDSAHEPRFTPRPARSQQTAPRNQGGWGSLTLIRNTANLGGCGGFNTGFASIDQLFAGERAPDFVWLVDDDIDLPPDALERLTEVALREPDVGLVGSRTMDIDPARRDTTIETTIYFDRDKGVMCPEPPPGHPRRAEYDAWLTRVGERIGKHDYRGTLNVDIASACSLLARWSAVTKGDPARSIAPVGFWDWRYFIYCDDADWSLRFAKAGWRIVLNLDAVVYHTPWLLKLTPQRLYYAQRNAMWMVQKVLPPAELRRVSRKWMCNLLRDALRAATHRRLFHAGIILQTIEDTIDTVPGKTAPEGSPKRDVGEALRELAPPSATGPTIAVCIPHEGALTAAGELINLASKEPHLSAIRWLLLVSNTVPGFEHGPPAHPGSLLGFPGSPSREQIDCLVYAPRRASKLKKQLAIWTKRPRAVVIFDQTNDLPILRSAVNIHIDTKAPNQAQMEVESLGVRLALAARLLRVAARAAVYSLRVRPFRSSTRYG